MATKMTWDGNADQQLLLSILAAHDIKIDFDAVATYLGCTPRAVQERLKKLKKMATDQNGTAPATPKTPSKTKAGVAKSNATTPTSTPKKRKIATPKSAKAASKGKKDAKLGEVDATEEGQNGEGLEISDHDELGGHAVDPAYTGVTGSDEYFQQHHDADFYANENGVIHGEY